MATSTADPLPAQPGTGSPPVGSGLAARRVKSQGGRPTKAAAAALEQRILAKAADLFAAQGYAATSMEQVADACQAGKDTIYRRYPSKALLFTALMARFRAEHLDALGRVATQPGTPLVRLQRHARALLDTNLSAQLLALNRVALGEAVFAQGVQAVPAHEDPFLGQLAALVGEAQAAQQLGPGDAAFMAEQLLYATSIKPLISMMLGEARFTDPDEVQAYFDRAWRLFMQGAAGQDSRA